MSNLMYSSSDDRKYDTGYMRFVGYSNSSSLCGNLGIPPEEDVSLCGNLEPKHPCMKGGNGLSLGASPLTDNCLNKSYAYLFSSENLEKMSCKITQLLEGVGYIIVPKD